MSKSMLGLIAAGLAAVCVVSALVRARATAGAGAVPNESTVDAGPAVDGGHLPEGAAYVEVGVWNWVEAEYKQSYTVRDFREVEVTDHVQDPSNGIWASSTLYGTSSFDIIRASSARNDDFAFAGFAADGDLVVENWKIKTKWVRPAMPGGPSGPAQAIKLFKKTEVYRGALATDIVAMNFDAEARFILVLVRASGQAGLYRFENTASSPATLVLDSNDVTELDDMHYLDRLDHTVLGRVWKLDDQPIFTKRILLVDGNNDGVFDGAPLVGSRAYFESNGLNEYDDWNSLIGP